jgi:MFS family permease
MNTQPTDPADPATPPEPRTHSSGFGAFRYAGFRIYFVGMVARGAAMWMPLVAIPWLAVETGSTAAEIGAITALFFLPTLFIGALGGVLADRAERRNVLVMTQTAAAVLSFLVFLVVISDTATLLTLGLAMMGFGALIAVEVPVRQAFMIELVPRSEIASAASLHATAWNVTRLFGPVLAGLLIATIGPAAPFALAAVVSLVVAVSVVWMDRYRDTTRHRGATTKSIAADLREGLDFVLGEPTVRWSFLLIAAIATFGISSFVTLSPLFATEDLSLGAGGFGAFVGASGAGAVTAALLVTAFVRGDRRPWLIVGAGGMALLLALMSFVDILALAFVLAFLMGASQITVAQNALVSVQQATPDDIRGRVMGLWVMVFQGASLVGAILAGWLAELAGVRSAFLVSAIALALITVAVGVGLRNVPWRSTPEPQPAPEPHPA